ncbi:Plasmodium variant antigen protein Cir/Yir/Bir, putative [Plasmodium chabaudi chabaudi]|uniref:Plasmodium variant antigen protein Cir/Yir/Bir, putative n=1 Tax=Plasmodium chabaudi chabaudi TaxID=31271 RepID=A0A1D3L9M8_PLACU|nr:Plasmodium variant antigen protein Cir/Yir/Bir, putative [Plasmodium chabaudi chabaudi]
MSEEHLCKLFLDADNLLINNKVVNEKIFKQDGRYNQYCRNRNCKTNDERICALATYLFVKLSEKTNNQHYKHFLMWLSDKLYEIENDNKITLKESYEKNLNASIGSLNYWNVVNSSLKDANLRHMRELYNLLKYICNTVTYYKNNSDNNKELLQKSVYCLNQYRNLYNNFPKCNSYLHLLDELKKMYENFRNDAIKKDTNQKNNIANRLQILTTPDKKDLYFAENLKIFDFKGPECAKLNSKAEQQHQSTSAQPEEKEKLAVETEALSKSLLQLLSHLSSQLPSLSQLSSLPQLSPQLKQSEPSDKSNDDNEEKEETQQSTIQEPTDSSNNIECGQITEHHLSEIDVKGNISEIASSRNIFNEYKALVFSVIAIAIPVILAVMYKFLAPIWRKKMKKKTMKKIINLCDEKKTKEEAANTFIEKNQSE